MRDNVPTRFETVVTVRREAIWRERRIFFDWGGRATPVACLKQSERPRGALTRQTALWRHALIAAISGPTPMMFITRVML